MRHRQSRTFIFKANHWLLAPFLKQPPIFNMTWHCSRRFGFGPLAVRACVCVSSWIFILPEQTATGIVSQSVSHPVCRRQTVRFKHFKPKLFVAQSTFWKEGVTWLYIKHIRVFLHLLIFIQVFEMSRTCLALVGFGLLAALLLQVSPSSALSCPTCGLYPCEEPVCCKSETFTSDSCGCCKVTILWWELTMCGPVQPK